MENSSHVPCIAWVKRGGTKQPLERVKHTKEELQEIIKELKLKEAEFTGRPRPKSADKSEEGHSSDSDNDHEEVDDFYDLNDYDDDAGGAVSGIDEGVERLLLNNELESDSEDSDAEPDEFTVKEDDHLILAGQIDKDIPMLLVMVFNHEKEEFFILHDIMLPSYPFAIEWLDFNPADVENSGNFAAVGGMDPVIDVWDLNVSGSLEPAFRLTSKNKGQNHTDAVLDLTWNSLSRNVLASGSVDQTVILWDLAQKKCVKRLTLFEEKIQSLKWHPSESQNLLVGCCDGKVRLFDCRSPQVFKAWEFEGEIERVIWNEVDPMAYYTTTDNGMVYMVDVRQTKPLWTLKAHNKEVTGITVGKYCSHFMVTASMDETVKIWDLKDSKPQMICQKFMNIGPILTLTTCPDVPYVFCAGGSKKDNHLFLWDARDNDAVLNRFVNNGRLFSKPPNSAEQSMNAEEPQPCTSSSLHSVENNLGGRVRHKKSKRRATDDQQPSSSAGTQAEEKKKSKKPSHKSLHPKTPKE